MDNGKRLIMLSSKKASVPHQIFINCYTLSGEILAGKIKSNLAGNEFRLFDNGVEPKLAQKPEEIRRELGNINYETYTVGNNRPTKIKALLPLKPFEPNVNSMIKSNDGQIFKNEKVYFNK